jgi:hypothetical protein
MRQVLAVVCMAVVAVVGCNKSSNPSAPSNSNTVVSISLNSSSGALAFGAMETFTATATLAGGGTQPVTGGVWGSDAQTVAQVSASGQVTAVGIGLATVFVDFQGMRGTKLIRVLQNFAGEYSGTYVVDACAESGDFVEAEFCTTPWAPGSALALAFLFAQTGASLTGQTALGGIISGQFSATVRDDGSATVQVTANVEGILVTQTWQLRADQSGFITGSFRIVISAPGLTGNTTIDATISTAVRVSSSSAAGWQPARTHDGADRLEALRRLIATRR